MVAESATLQLGITHSSPLCNTLPTAHSASPTAYDFPLAEHWKWRPYKVIRPFIPKRTEMGHPVPTKTFLQPRPDAAMLFAPCGYTHPPPPVPRFLLKQNLSPKENIVRSDIVELKVS